MYISMRHRIDDISYVQLWTCNNSVLNGKRNDHHIASLYDLYYDRFTVKPVCI
jgi:hypothetical protein